MPTTEHTINDELAAQLRRTRRAWSDEGIVRSENTGQLVGGQKRPDILILEPNSSPVDIETEVLPAISVEAEAKSRLGEKLACNGDTLLSSIAVRIPKRVRAKSGLALGKEFEKARDLEMVMFTGSSPENATRWPESGWLTGGIVDLSALAQAAAVPPEVIDKAATALVNGVEHAAGVLSEMASQSPGAMQKICEELHQHDDEQTRRMAATIIANAFVFQETLAGGAGELARVRTIGELRHAGSLTKSDTLAQWSSILKVNYWPIFDIARRLLEVVPAAYSKRLIERLSATADGLVENHLMRSHDLTGAVFQRLIVDRKFLAAFYTTPASAALLAGLAIAEDSPLASTDWANPASVASLRIGDFACGTGTLLSSAYQRVGQLHEMAGGDFEAIHKQMMEKTVVGCDVLPAAAHLTASMLSGTHPRITYEGSRILTVPYGIQADKSIALGSIDMLDSQARLDIIAIAARASAGQGELDTDTWVEVPHHSFDVVIMNPPFTRSTGHEAAKIGIPRPMWAAFGSSAKAQKLMAKAASALTKGTSAHGNAGEGSIFLVLADRKLKKGGTLALILPLSLLAGDAWQGSRTFLAKNYNDLIIISIAAERSEEMSFSADTGMGECIIVGRRTQTKSSRATFVLLAERPSSTLSGSTLAKQIRALLSTGALRKLEDGPVGGTPLTFGDAVVGRVLDAPLSLDGVWNPNRIADLALAQSAFQLMEKKRVWLPGMAAPSAVPIPIVPLTTIAAIGPYHADINFGTNAGGIRGPFALEKLKPSSVPTYPVLWAHDANRERTLAFGPDHDGRPKQGKTFHDKKVISEKAAEIWSTASHCHFNQNFQFNSQSTAMQYTPSKAIGGRAWLSVSLKSADLEKVLVLWGNSSLGLLLHWYSSNKQQSGRGNIGKEALQSLPILDVNALTPKQVKAAVQLFDELSVKPLATLSELHKDEVRSDLDRRFLGSILGLEALLFEEGGSFDLLRRKLAAEPSISGGKGVGAINVDDDDD